MSRAVWRQADAVTESGVVRDAAYGEPLGRVGALIQRAYPREVLADSPAGYWRLGETSGTQAFDASGNGRHGTFGGTHVLGQSGLLPGDTDGAVKFGAPNQAGNVTYTTVPMMQHTVTLEWWMHPEGEPDSQYWGIVNRISFGNSGYTIPITNTGGTHWGIYARLDTSAATNQSRPMHTSVDLFDGDPHHVVLVIDAGVGRWYADGVQVGNQFTYSHGDGFTNPVNLALSYGAASGANPPALLDEFAIYPSALSPERIAAHYAARLLDAQPALSLAIPDLGAESFGAGLGFAPLYDSAALPAGEYVVYDRRDDADNRVTLVYQRPENRWALHRYASGSDDPLYVEDTFTAGAVKHLAIGGDAGHLYLQVDGGTRNEGDNAHVSTLASDDHDIGQAGGTGALPAVYAYAIPYWRAYTEAEGAHFASLARPPHTGDVPPVVLP